MHRPREFAGNYHRFAQALSALLTQSDNNIVRKIENDMARLQEKYTAELHEQIKKKLGLENSMQVPRITKITLNMGVGEAVADKKVLDNAVGDMEKIAGQKAVKTLARKSVAGFKIRDGYPIGCKVTLRRERMYEFLDRLVNIAIPRIRDFRGLNPKSFDKQGNYSMGVSEQIIFPEINYDQIDAIRGMDITVSTTARNAEEGRALLEAFNFPFKK
jgi:large subunit ribosomal protein L5